MKLIQVEQFRCHELHERKAQLLWFYFTVNYDRLYIELVLQTKPTNEQT